MKYPQDIAEDELDSGFERVELEEMGHAPFRKPAIVVAKLLSPSDVLIKIYSLESESIRYSHRRWGYRKGSEYLIGWMPLLEPMDWESAQKLIQEFAFEGTQEAHPGETVGIPFKYRVVE